jgi:hypothetical protein
MSKVEVKIYTCEVKRLFKADALKEWRWVERAVAEAIESGDAQYRCKDCHGAVKLHGKNVPHGPAPHVEHRFRADSEYCVAGIYFREASDGRQPRLSEKPVK